MRKHFKDGQTRFWNGERYTTDSMSSMLLPQYIGAHRIFVDRKGIHFTPPMIKRYKDCGSHAYFELIDRRIVIIYKRSIIELLFEMLADLNIYEEKEWDDDIVYRMSSYN